jgi:hypothetical protein
LGVDVTKYLTRKLSHVIEFQFRTAELAVMLLVVSPAGAPQEVMIPVVKVVEDV